MKNLALPVHCKDIKTRFYTRLYTPISDRLVLIAKSQKLPWPPTVALGVFILPSYFLLPVGVERQTPPTLLEPFYCPHPTQTGLGSVMIKVGLLKRCYKEPHRGASF